MIDFLWENRLILAACLVLLCFTVACTYYGIKLLMDVD